MCPAHHLTPSSSSFTHKHTLCTAHFVETLKTTAPSPILNRDSEKTRNCGASRKPIIEPLSAKPLRTDVSRNSLQLQKLALFLFIYLLLRGRPPTGQRGTLLSDHATNSECCIMCDLQRRRSAVRGTRPQRGQPPFRWKQKLPAALRRDKTAACARACAHACVCKSPVNVDTARERRRRAASQLQRHLCHGGPPTPGPRTHRRPAHNGFFVAL